MATATTTTSATTTTTTTTNFYIPFINPTLGKLILSPQEKR
jgi:hypothetical protein